VILLDEIEKAHHDVFNVLLQILDEGRLTDGQGRTVNFKNTLLIMTSNLGSQYYQEIEDKAELKAKLEAELKANFRPEFLNRVDEIAIFNQLSHEDIKQIVEIQLLDLQKRLAERKITLVLSAGVKDYLASAGFDPHFGARPLKRLIQKKIQDPLALKVLSNEFREGQKVKAELDKKKEEIAFSQ
jgi:ATP-dependent Clp protease ATP-binding subunit ClpB